MSTSYQALCNDFFVNARLGVKMDLPSERQTVLDLFERVRREDPGLNRFRRFDGELALESRGVENAADRWVSLRRTSVRSGVVNPASLEAAHRLHRFVMQIAPFYLSVNPLDVSSVEVSYGFDLEARGNHHAIIHDALLAGSPLGAFFDSEGPLPIDLAPVVGGSLSKGHDLQVFLDVKPRTTLRVLRSGEPREDPISVFLSVRKTGALDAIKQTTELYEDLSELLDQIAQEKALPLILSPLREAIASQQY